MRCAAKRVLDDWKACRVARFRVHLSRRSEIKPLPDCNLAARRCRCCRFWQHESHEIGRMEKHMGYLIPETKGLELLCLGVKWLRIWSKAANHS